MTPGMVPNKIPITIPGITPAMISGLTPGMISGHPVSDNQQKQLNINMQSFEHDFYELKKCKYKCCMLTKQCISSNNYKRL